MRTLQPVRGSLISPFNLHHKKCNLELHVKTVKYFKSNEYVQEQVEKSQRELKARGEIPEEQVGSME